MATLTLDNYPKSGSWPIRVSASENNKTAIAQIFWNENDRPTSKWEIPIEDLEVLIAFAKTGIQQGTPH